MRVQAVTNEAEFADALSIRFAVFVDEQAVDPESERDNLDDDPRTLHCVAYADDGTPLAVGRLLAPHTDTSHGAGTSHGNMDPALPHIGRVAAIKQARGTGAGRAVMEFLEEAALERHGASGEVRVELSAQDQAMDFYARLGYTAFGDGYLDEGIMHHDAYKVVSF
ncbi:GNAT family N-acetyltransferase [Demequina oxidasica]|uniref:GNAT family N-acetyltransferase n=1 Tax=Demequina oxidasica TaxID=676199 RepID=UPI000781F7CA|nr:GNAT family N-acetyltransferase [Demequina oxidasica]